MKNIIPFQKMHGLGNDFVVIDNVSASLALSKDFIVKISDRHLGVGCDQLLVIEKSKHADFFCRIYNSDGSEIEQCGNGLRCVARYIHEHHLIKSKTFTLETLAGCFPISIADYHAITMTFPTKHVVIRPVKLGDYQADTLTLGNPHALIRVDSIERTPIETLGNQFAYDKQFPSGANIGFMEIVGRDHMKLRTVERGAGLTYACGSNATAAALLGIKKDWLNKKVEVAFELGSLVIEYDAEKEVIDMTGPASIVFEGKMLM